MLKLKEQQESETQLYESTKQSLLTLLKTDNNLLKSIFGRGPTPQETDEANIEMLKREA